MRTLLIVMLLLQCMEVKASKMHILVAANVTDKNDILKIANKTDLKEITQLFSQIAKTINYQTNIIQFANDNDDTTKPFTTTSILSEIDKLEVQEDDIIYFFCHTHGLNSTDPKNGFPRLYIGKHDNEVLEVSKIRERLQKKNPRLSLVFINACNGRNGDNKINRISRKPFHNVSLEKLAPLFIGIRGEVVVTSSHRKYVSRSWYDGGLAYNAIINNLIRIAEGEIKNINWHHLINKSCEELSSHFGSTPYYEISLHNAIKVKPHDEKFRKADKNGYCLSSYQNIHFKTNDKNRLYALNSSNQAVLLMIIFEDADGQKTASRLHMISPRKKVYLRNSNFSPIRHLNGNMHVFLKKLNRGDPRYNVAWEGGNSVFVNGVKTPMDKLDM